MPSYDPQTIASAALIRWGARVDRATATLPASTLGNLYTVAGGRVMVSLLIGQVTTVIQSQATTIKVTSTPTTGSAVDLSGTVDCNGLEVGGLLTVIGTFATALGKQNAGGAQGLNLSPIVVPAGSIGITTGATSSGSIKWSIFYHPLDDGAYIVAI